MRHGDPMPHETNRDDAMARHPAGSDVDGSDYIRDLGSRVEPQPMTDEQLEAALSATAKSLRREKAVLDLINYGEWLDCQHLMCSLVDDERTHEELARDYLAQR